MIDLCIIFQKLLIIKDNYGKSDIKFFLYHLVNDFSDDDDKLEDDFKFLKCGIELLIKNYKLTDFEEYFHHNDKEEMRNNLYTLISNLLFYSQQYIMNKKDESVFLDKKNEHLDKLTNIINTTKKLREDKEEKNFLKNVKSILNNFYHAFWDEEIFEEIITFLNIFNEEIPKTINDFYYSTFCCKRKDSKQLYEKIDELIQ